jgi:hypothetical protein
MRNRDKRKLEEEHSGQVTGFTGITKSYAASQWKRALQRPVRDFYLTIFPESGHCEPLYNRSGPCLPLL